MTAAASPLEQDLAVHIRNARSTDAAYIRTTFRESWGLNPENRRIPWRGLKPIFRDVVVDGVLAEPETRVLVGCVPHDPDVILCWAAFTPGLVTTIHWVYVRAELDGVYLRRRGLFGILLGAMGVRDGSDVAYTSRPQEHRAKEQSRRLGIEAALLGAADRHGIVAKYVPLSEWLGGGRKTR